MLRVLLCPSVAGQTITSRVTLLSRASTKCSLMRLPPGSHGGSCCLEALGSPPLYGCTVYTGRYPISPKMILLGNSVWPTFTNRTQCLSTGISPVSLAFCTPNKEDHPDHFCIRQQYQKWPRAIICHSQFSAKAASKKSPPPTHSFPLIS